MKSLVEKVEILLDDVDLTDASNMLGIATSLKQINALIRHDESINRFSNKFADDAHDKIANEVLSELFKTSDGLVEAKAKIIETVISLITSIILLVIQSKRNSARNVNVGNPSGVLGVIGKAKEAVTRSAEKIATNAALKAPYAMLDAVSNNDTDSFNIASIKVQNLFTQSLTKLTKNK